MEPNKFDYSIKEKMEARSIAPSADSWDRLDVMLDTAEVATRKKRSHSWIYIAAGLIAFLFLATVFNMKFDTHLIQKNIPVVVNQNNSTVRQKEELVRKEEVFSEKVVNQNSQGKQVVATNLKSKKATSSKESPVLVAVDPRSSKDKENTINSPVTKDIATVTSNKYISAAELLAIVTNVKSEKIVIERATDFPKQNYKVNPNTLLTSAETELNQTFRETAINKLSKNFNSIKTVLVNRNYEE